MEMANSESSSEISEKVDKVIEDENETELRNRRKCSGHHSPLVQQVIDKSWEVIHYYSLPEWLQDNEYLHHWHRPPSPSISSCLRSIFRIHTETINIWTHLIGCAAFLAMSVYVLTHREIDWQHKMVISPYLIGAICCMGFSFTFHTFICHSESVGRFFGRLDYLGISLLITCSFIPSLYYAFYCHRSTKFFYIGMVIVLGMACSVVTIWERFSEPRFRPLRASVFASLGLFGVVPTIHYMWTHGLWTAVNETSFVYLILMATLYLCGAVLYAMRIPERFFPGRCDVLFQSHQLMHTLVVIAAFVHYQGIWEMARQRAVESCDNL